MLLWYIETTFEGLLLYPCSRLAFSMWNCWRSWWNWAWVFHTDLALNQFLFGSWRCDTTCKQKQMKCKYKICSSCNKSAIDWDRIAFLCDIHHAGLQCLYLPQYEFHLWPSSPGICTFQVTKSPLEVWMGISPTAFGVWIFVPQFVTLIWKL